MAVYDLSGIYDGVKTDIFVDIVHTVAEGREMIARSMADQLASRASLRAPGAPRSLAASGG